MFFEPRKPLSSALDRLKASMVEVAKELVDPFTELDTKNDPDLVIDSDREEDENFVNIKERRTLSCVYFISNFCK